MANVNADLVNLLQQLCAALKVPLPSDSNNTSSKTTKDTKTPRRSKRKIVDDAEQSEIEASKRRLSEAKLEKQKREQELKRQQIKNKLNMKLNMMEMKSSELKKIIEDIKAFVVEHSPEADLNIEKHEEQIAKEIAEIKKLVATVQQGETDRRNKIRDEIESLKKLVDREEEESQKKYEELRKAMEETSAKINELLKK